MTITKTTQAFAEMTASGPSEWLDIRSVRRASLHCNHVNGAGTCTDGAVVVPEYKGAGSIETHRGQSLSFSTIAEDEETLSLRIPDAVAYVRMVYTAPTGVSGTLNAEVLGATF